MGTSRRVFFSACCLSLRRRDSWWLRRRSIPDSSSSIRRSLRIPYEARRSVSCNSSSDHQPPHFVLQLLPTHHPKNLPSASFEQQLISSQSWRAFFGALYIESKRQRGTLIEAHSLYDPLGVQTVSRAALMLPQQALHLRKLFPHHSRFLHVFRGL